MGMELNLQQWKLDYEDYRRSHGEKSLFTYVSKANGSLCIVKESTASRVELVEVFGGAERQINRAELDSDYFFWMQDETVFMFGSDERKEAALSMANAVSAAIKQIVYRKASLPMKA